MKRFLISIILFFAPFCFATTPVTGTLQTLGTSVVTSGTFVRFWLRGCGGNQPRINGTAIIAPTQGGVYYFDLIANGSGAISGTLYSTRDSSGTGNGDIECGGSKTAVWYGMQAYTAGKGGPEVPVHAKSGITLDISNVVPLSSTPVVTAPTGDSTYARLDTGNQPFAGTVTATAFSGPLTGNVTGNLTGAHNGTVGATTPNTGSFTSLTAQSQLSGAVQNCETFAGANAGAKIAACLTAVGSQGVADARGLFTSPQATSAITVPANVTLLLPPVPIGFNVGSNCMITLGGNGAKVFGSVSASSGLATSAWTGTVLQAVSPAAGTKGICASQVEQIQVKDIAVDMVPAGGTSTAGSDCFNFTGISNGRYENIFGYHCGGNGFQLNVTGTNHSYDNVVIHAWMRFVALDGWLIGTSGGAQDIDRFTCIDCQYHAYDASSSVTRAGANGIHLAIPNGCVVAQSIVSVKFINTLVFGTVSGATNYGLFLDNSCTSSYIKNVTLDGEVEGGFSADAGIAVHSNGDATHLVDTVFLEPLLIANFNTTNDLTVVSANNFRLSDQSTGVTMASSYMFRDRSTLGGTATFPSGGLVYASSAGGSYRLGIDSGGILRYQRTDTGPTDLWLFSGQTNQIYPGTDNTGEIGQQNANWAKIWAYKHNWIEGTAPSGIAGYDMVYGDSTYHGLKAVNNNTNPHNLAVSEVGSCAMSAATTCTFSIGFAFSSTPKTFASIDAASTVPATANSAKCSVSGTTVTITAGISNSLTWDCLLIGNPN